MTEEEARAALIELVESYGMEVKDEWIERHPNRSPDMPGRENMLGYFAYSNAPPMMMRDLRVAWTVD